MFESYSYLGRMFLMSIVVLGIMFSGQLFIYWLIDKYTSLNFPLIYRVILAIIVIIGYLMAGCTIPEVVPEPESPIVCEGGHYSVRFRDWQLCGCPSCETYEKGTYWVNDNERMFLLGEPVINPIEVYGKCPDDYIYEIEL